MILPTIATAWTLFLIFGTVITHTETNEDDLLTDSNNSTSRKFLASSSTIYSMKFDAEK